jgi:hypothetical protein
MMWILFSDVPSLPLYQYLHMYALFLQHAIQLIKLVFIENDVFIPNVYIFAGRRPKYISGFCTGRRKLIWYWMGSLGIFFTSGLGEPKTKETPDRVDKSIFVLSTGIKSIRY